MSTPVVTLDERIAQFKVDVERYLADYIDSPSQIVLASAWLISDNVILDLWHRFFPNALPSIVGVDTLHLFPETHAVVDEIAARYNVKPLVVKPEGCETLADFVSKFGTHETLSHAAFDAHSKIDPLTGAFDQLKKRVAITGRRADQGNARVTLAVWEEDKKTFNPLADWSWQDVTEYTLIRRVPYNALHRVLSVSDTYVAPVDRDKPHLAKFRHVQLALPYFAYDQDAIKAHGKFVYVWKSFGDTHTTVPVELDKSERAGRFVGREQTECGIHTRIAPKGVPHGGILINRVLAANDPKIAELRAAAKHKIVLTERQTCDAELIANGGFSPLTGFLDLKAYEKVVHTMRLPEEQLFGLPITLDTDNEEIQEGDIVELVDDLTNGQFFIQVDSKWVPNRTTESVKCFGTASLEHPSAFHLLTEKKKYNIGGPLWATALPKRDWVVCRTPAEVRATKTAGRNLVAFQSRNPLHKAHVAMFLQVASEFKADVMVHPVVGPTKGDDVPPQVRKQVYDVLAAKLTNVHFDYLPYSMLVAGPREALQHIIIRKNYGCTHMIVGRDHAGCKDASGKDFYGPWDAQELLKPLQKELGIDMVAFRDQVYVQEENRYMSGDEAKEKGFTPLSISGTKFRSMLLSGEDIPEWFAYPDVITVLRKWAQQQQQQSVASAAQ
ncbi:ATP sulfurylase Ats1 [Capsaspora owczarzaki ATCC 30864]|uniref:sulfate adenylyltransferase n=1 Tax=Capsaspora owczarzaki (strain ATCC 30864) TaxID=595528 RepID=A0A0D2X1Q9_CAPO3|nr:ATP sulfurylase Ats1 [Capsaspora owczarzaki ATCC 30864]KJE91239.1 ATP sulfurylase Ats1 [Capsaspora owczarzaki ATCC 30864]|eukprot:XP_004349154.1 ATP sulfurylase Ats1 [Capsaspora owczarzaki ATCC 30864]